MADGSLAAALAEIRAALLPVTSAAELPGAHAGQAALRLLAAVDEVIRLLAGASRALSAPPRDCTRSCVSGACGCSGNWRTLTWDLDPGTVREAMAEALAGKGNDGG